MLQIDSSNDDVIKYAWLVKKNAKDRDERVKNSFSNFMWSKKWYKKKVVFTTWSDWRYENKSHEWIKSNIELVIIEDESLDKDYPLVKSAEELWIVIKKNISFILDFLEIKKIWKDSLTLFNNDSNLVFPTRI